MKNIERIRKMNVNELAFALDCPNSNRACIHSSDNTNCDDCIKEWLNAEEENLVSKLGFCEILCQLAEEASELSKAALKLRRAMDRTNPTPRSLDSCVDNLIEEIADCYICIDYLRNLFPEDFHKRVTETCEEKDRRWNDRLREVQKDE